MLPERYSRSLGTPPFGAVPMGSSGKDPYQALKASSPRRQRLRDQRLSDTDIAQA